MPYPVTASQTVAVSQTMTMTFRPAAAGLINVVVLGSAIIPASPPTGGAREGDPPPIPVASLRLELFAPGATTPVLSKADRLEIRGTVRDRIIVWGDAPAAASQLAADWTVKVTNLGNLPASFDVTARYQVEEGNLGKVDHIFVLMMENRSFDHMLGYLKLTGANGDVDGLTGHEINHDGNNAPQQVHLLTETNFTSDPGHGWTDVAGALPGTTLSSTAPPYQLSADRLANLTSNGGFVRNFEYQERSETALPPHDQATINPGLAHTFEFQPKQAGTLGARALPLSTPAQSQSGLLGRLSLRTPGGGTPVTTQTAPIGSGAISVSHTVTATELALTGNWTCEVTNSADTPIEFITDISNSIGPGGLEPAASIMGYYDKSGVPAYDYLATQFAVCDRWFASIPTDTFPNRLYAMTGGSGGLLTTPSDASVATNPPAYGLKTIFEVLQEHNVDWNIFFSDLPFALVFTALAQDAQYTARMRPISEFLDRAATGELPAVAWIDPNFNDVPDGTDNASDDHPPGDVKRGQQFVEQVFNALVASPAWSKTMLIITYDEHGGFFDHVEPPGTPPRNDGPKDDDPDMTRYGLRVPSIVVSPWVAQGQVAHTIFDHTSMLRTILLRFCATPREVATDGADRRVSLGGGLGLGSVVPSMGARTDNANDLGGLLSLGAPRVVSPFGQPTAALAQGMVSHSPLIGIGATIRRGVLGF
jgi:phospholipase C